MTVSTANAAKMSNLQASVTIIEPITIECTPIDFGTLYFSQNSLASSDLELQLNNDGSFTQIGSSTTKYKLWGDQSSTPGTCTGLPNDSELTPTINHSINLDENGNIYLYDIIYTYGKLIGKLHIDADAVLNGTELTGSTVLQFTYE